MISLSRGILASSPPLLERWAKYDIYMAEHSLRNPIGRPGARGSEPWLIRISAPETPPRAGRRRGLSLLLHISLEDADGAEPHDAAKYDGDQGVS